MSEKHLKYFIYRFKVEKIMWAKSIEDVIDVEDVDHIIRYGKMKGHVFFVKKDFVLQKYECFDIGVKGAVISE